MDNQPPPRPPRTLPSSADLSAAVDTVLADHGKTAERLGRVMAVVAAAGVRDILTGNDEHAPYDARAIELAETPDGSLHPTGRYWTEDGARRTFADTVGHAEAGNGLHDLSGWTAYLDGDNRDTWEPACTQLEPYGGRTAYALDLDKAAALPIGPAPARGLAHRPLSAMVDVLVCANDHDRYSAKVDPADQRDGHVRPWFALDTVREIAEDTQAEAARYGHGSADTVHVVEGDVHGMAHAVVLVVSWMYMGSEWRREAAEILHPNAEGRYAVGGHDWCWYALDDHQNPQIPFRPASQ